MTRKQFDAITKENNGRDFGQRTEYRAARRIDSRCDVDTLAARAAYLARRGKSPLWIGSPMRASAMYRASMR